VKGVVDLRSTGRLDDACQQYNSILQMHVNLLHPAPLGRSVSIQCVIFPERSRFWRFVDHKYNHQHSKHTQLNQIMGSPINSARIPYHPQLPRIIQQNTVMSNTTGSIDERQNGQEHAHMTNPCNEVFTNPAAEAVARTAIPSSHVLSDSYSWPVQRYNAALLTCPLRHSVHRCCALIERQNGAPGN